MSSVSPENNPLHDGIMAHEAEITLPGSFVILQGIPGDGMANTIDTAPTLAVPESVPETESEDEFTHVPTNMSQDSDGLVVSDDRSHTSSEPALARTVPGGYGQTLVSQSMAVAVPPSLAAFESFIVVSDDASSNKIPQRRHLAPQEQAAIYSWQTKCRQSELLDRREWLFNSDNKSEEEWWQDEGQLAVLGQVPRRRGTCIERTVLTTLSPGSTVVGTKLVCLDALTLVPVPTTRHPRDGLLQLLQLESPLQGYVLLSRNGHLLVGPGLPSLYTDPHVWIWRVTCAAGAYVREGLELDTRHVATLPYGTLMRVTRKTVNEQGLTRLRIHGHTNVEGWISEFLNPQSGQRGSIAQPVPFPVPALYRVTLPEGALIRSGVELSSPRIGNARMGAVLSVVGRVFSDHPMDQCIERLKLAGNGGWVSVRLNKPRPYDELVVELEGIDGSFDPDAPGLFHLDAQQQVLQEVGDYTLPTHPSPDTINNNNNNNNQIVVTRSGIVVPPKIDPQRRHHRSEDKCLICLTEERNATIVHGETGHVACCLICARILKARGDRCPVCRLSIDSVIQQFWA